MSNTNWTLIAQYLSDACDKEEKNKVEQLLKENAEFKQALKGATQLWEGSNNLSKKQSNRKSEAEIDHAISKMSALIDVENRETPKTIQFTPSPQKTQSFSPYQVAASVAILALLATFVVWFSQGVKPIDADQMVTVITEKGKQQKVTLPDGSKVWLNVASKITYPSHFTGDTRKVSLEGEAFFDVKRNPEKPFIIESHNTYTEVLGTSFNLRSYKDAEAITLTVKTGRVGFLTNAQTTRKAEEMYFVSPNQQVVFSKKDKQVATFTNVPTDNLISWKESKLVFNNDDLQTVFKTLERWYDVEIVITDESIKHLHFTSQFSDESLAFVLEQIVATHHQALTISNSDDKITVSSK